VTADYVPFAAVLDRAAKACGVNFVGGVSARGQKGCTAAARPLIAALPAGGYEPFPSQSNFVLARRARGGSARPAYEALKARRILVRHFDTPRLADCLRITVGTDEEVAALLEAMKKLR
jgi:histidinol-phosphate/aromatic aminotransferase/cobyric acid decarboxylase-like protein